MEISLRLTRPVLRETLSLPISTTRVRSSANILMGPLRLAFFWTGGYSRLSTFPGQLSQLLTELTILVSLWAFIGITLATMGSLRRQFPNQLRSLCSARSWSGSRVSPAFGVGNPKNCTVDQLFRNLFSSLEYGSGARFFRRCVTLRRLRPLCPLPVPTIRGNSAVGPDPVGTAVRRALDRRCAAGPIRL